MSAIRIGGIEKFSIVDFPNRMSAVVFMQGCPWRCPFCHNTHLQDVNAETNIVWKKFMDFLEQRKGMLDAVVFSGGEPLVQDTLGAAMDEVKALGYQIGLHTGGYRPAHLKEVLSKTDWVGFDIKAPLEAERYKCRTTCDPRFLSVKDIYTIADTLKGLGVKEYYLQKYRKVPSDTDTTESQCLALVEDTALLAYLQGCFDVFDVRK